MPPILLPLSILHHPKTLWLEWWHLFLLTNLSFGQGSAGTSLSAPLGSSWSGMKPGGLSHLQAARSSVWWLGLAVGWDLMELLYVPAWLPHSMVAGHWGGLSRFYDMSQKSYSISFPVVTGLSRLKMKEHRPYLLVDKWQYHIVRTHGMEYIGATIFGK